MIGDAELLGFLGSVKHEQGLAGLFQSKNRVANAQTLREARADVASAARSFQRGRREVIKNARNKIETLGNQYKERARNNSAKYKNTLRSRAWDRLFRKQTAKLNLQKLRTNSVAQRYRDRVGSLSTVLGLGKRGVKLVRPLQKTWRRMTF